jgi:hypothetical protein
VLSAIVKPVETLTAADLSELVERQWPESENVEYKAELYREGKDRPDPWYTNGNISVASKNKIFKELVAFANTSGGRLFLGIKETPDKPPRADSIQPIPRCCDLAERLEQSIINSVDPPLTFFRVVGVPTDGDSGVLVAEVSASYNGPHRSPDLHCYVRKGTNSVPVGMREIHDIVMRLSRRQDEIQRRFSERRDRFRFWLGERHPMVQNLKAAFRATAVPVGAPLHIERVFNNRDVSRGFHGGSGTWRRVGSDPILEEFPSPIILSERPVLGGAAWISSRSDDISGTKAVHRDGLVDIWFKWPWYSVRGSTPNPMLPFNWIIAAAADAIASAEAFKQAVQSPACEYGLQLELLATNGPAEVSLELAVNRMGFMQPFASAFETPTIFGPYSIGDQDAAINSIVRDLLDASGEVNDLPRLEIDWASVRN